IERLNGIEQLPIRVAHVGERRRNRAAQLDFRCVAVQRRDDQLLPIVVDEKTAKQRLRQRERKIVVERWVVVQQVVRADLLVVVELKRKSPAAPWDQLLQSGVVRRR